MANISFPNSSNGGGGGTISNPGVVYVQTNGNDSTGEIGNPAKPYLTAAAAVTDLGAVSHMTFVFGVGTFTADAILDSGVTSCHITGQGHTRTIVNMTWVGEDGEEGVSGGPGVATDGEDGESFSGMTITSDQSADIRVSITGGGGNTGGNKTDGFGMDGGDGGSIGACTLRGVYGSIYLMAGLLGTGGTGPEGNGADGSDGTVADVNTNFCKLTLSGLATIANGSHLSILNGLGIVEM